MSKRLASLLLALILLLSLSVVASATDPTVTPYNGQIGNGPYGISTAAQLAKLAQMVNAGNTYSGVIFYLTANINLAVGDSITYDGVTLSWTANTNWTPIGGMCGEDSNYVPNGNSFRGVFNGYYGGNVHSISNISLSQSATTSTKAGYGLFGYVNGGAIGNLILSGNVSVSNSAEYVGGLVGYTSGNVYNITSTVSVTASGASNVGGIIGAAERRSGGDISVKYVKNGGAVSGSKRVGGVVGGIYSATGSIVTLDCAVNTGTVSAGGTQKVYAGGLVGYTRGDILHSYNTANVSASNGRYAGGITGLLNGYSQPYANMKYVFSTAAAVSASSDNKALWATADTSFNPVIRNAFWTATSLTQPITSTWGDCLMVERIDGDQLSGDDPISGNTITYYLNGNSASEEYFKQNSTLGRPVLVWEEDNDFHVDDLTVVDATGVSGNSDTTSMIFVDFVNGVDQSGTGASVGQKANPVKTLAKAITLLSSTRNVIYFLNTMTVSNQLSVDFSGTDYSGYDVFIKRSCDNSEYLFEVVTNGELTLGDVIIDGNRGDGNNGGAFAEAVKSLVNVDGGELYIDGATLRNNYANAGGAVRLIKGIATMSDGEITNCRSANAGGGVMVTGYGAFSGNGSFTITGGTITGNNAGTNGGGIAVTTYASLTMGVENATGGPTVSNNTAGAYGGGVSVAADGANGGSVFYLYGGTISGNKALYGSGVATIAEGLNITRTAKAYLNGGAIKANTSPGGNGWSSSNTGGGVYVDGYTEVTLNGAAIGGPNSGDGNIASWGGGVYVAGTFTMNGGSISNNTVTGGTTPSGLTIGGLGVGVYMKNGSSFTLGSANGLETNQIIYLAAPSSTSSTGTYVAIAVSLTKAITVQVPTPAVGIRVARKGNDISVSSTYIKCANNSYKVVGPNNSRWFTLDNQ